VAKGQTVRSKIIYLLLFVVIIAVGGSVITYLISTYPYRSEKVNAIRLARKYAGIETVSDFEYYSRDKTYYSVFGKSSNHESLIAVIPKSGGQIVTLKASEGISSKKAESISGLSGKDVSAALGLQNGEALWEVKKVTENEVEYVLVGFKDGEIKQN
jgi:uncharacterized protein YpmB